MKTLTAPLHDWLADPTACYASWLKTKRFTRQTRNVYFTMFAKFIAYLNVRNIRLDRCGPGHILGFFNEHQIQKNHRYRYIRVIECVFDYLNRAFPDAGMLNPASLAAKNRAGEGINDPMNFLTAAEIEQISAFLAKPAPSAQKKRKKNKKDEWKVDRDRAITAIMLFGAVKVSECLALTVNCVVENLTLLQINMSVETEEKTGLQGGVQGLENEEVAEQDLLAQVEPPVSLRKKRDAHIAQLLEGGRQCLGEWLAIRATLDIQGNVLFPANTEGQALHAASLYRGVMQVLEFAGIDTAQRGRISPQTLRNTYAVLMMQQGIPHAEIKASMGIYGDTSMLRIQHAYQQWLNAQS
jgi:site-specific recombinase XerD